MTVNEHESVCCNASVAVHVTVVVPEGKTVPEAGVHTTVTVPLHELLVMVGDA